MIFSSPPRLRHFGPKKETRNKGGKRKKPAKKTAVKQQPARGGRGGTSPRYRLAFRRKASVFRFFTPKKGRSGPVCTG